MDYRKPFETSSPEAVGIRSADILGYIDALGVHDIRIRITVPQDWTEKQCSAFFSSLLGFHCEIDGKQYESNMDRETNDGQTRIITLSFTDIPYDRIDAIRSLCIVPDLFTTEEMIVGSIHDGTAKRTPMQDNVQYIHPDTDENVSYHGEILTLSDGALTLTVR